MRAARLEATICSFAGDSTNGLIRKAGVDWSNVVGWLAPRRRTQNRDRDERRCRRCAIWQRGWALCRGRARAAIDVFSWPIVLKKSSNTQWRIDLYNIVVPCRLLAVVCCDQGIYCEPLFHAISGYGVFQHNRPLRPVRVGKGRASAASSANGPSRERMATGETRRFRPFVRPEIKRPGSTGAV